MRKNKPDFSGWVTKNDILCSDGVIIKHGSFIQNDGTKVPIVWQHDYSSPSNVLGYILLKHMDSGVWGEGYLNDTEHASDTKILLKHGDLNAMSIGARNIQKNGNEVIHGEIYEVSLVLKGANPGALIKHVMLHSAYGDEEYEGDRGIITTGITQDLLHTAIDEDKKTEVSMKRSYEEILEGLSEEERDTLLNGVIGDISAAIEEEESQNEDESGNEQEESENNEETVEDNSTEAEVSSEETVTQSIFEKEGADILKHNHFQGQGSNNNGVDMKAMDTLVHSAIEGNASSLAGVMRANGVLEADSIQHGLVGMEVLFPNTQTANDINVYNPGALNIDKIMGQFGKSPLPRVKNIFANLTEEDARARGYIKGNQTLNSIEEVFFRETTPGSVIRRESIDHDDLIDLKDGGFAAVNFIQQVQNAKFKEEIVRAAFLSDGRPLTLKDGKRNPDKISERHVRPIISDHPLYVINVTAASFETVVDEVVQKAIPAYQGSGKPCLYINPFDLAKLKTLKDKNGRYLYAPSMDNNQVPGNANIAAYFMCDEVVEYRAMPIGTMIIGNLVDYQFGMSVNGQIANFESFDIDFMQHKYLMSARLSGAIRTPKSFIVVKVTDKGSEDLSALDFDPTGLKAKPTWTVQTDPTEAKGVGSRAVHYDPTVNGIDMTEDDKKLGTVEESSGTPKKPKKKAEDQA